MKQFLGNVFIMVPRKTILIGTVLLYAFLTGLTQNILFSVPIARFLQEYSSDLLPVTYIGLGFTMFVLGWTFDYIQKKSSLFISIAVPIGLFSMMQFMFSWMLSVQSTFLIIPVLIGSILIVFFTGSVSSILYYQLFTTYELKRLYGCFCGAFGLGGIVMGFCMEILLKYMDPNHLMNIGSILMLMAFGCLFIIKKFSSKKLSENVDEEKEGIKEENESFQNKDKKYVFKIFILTGVSYFIYYIFDYVFNSQVKVFYGNDIERTIFYGHFYATVDILSLVVSFFIYPWLFIKFGQKGAFLSFPILMSVLSLGAFIVHLAPAQILWAFYIIILATIVLESFLESVVLSSMLQFFQPLKKNLREWAQFKNEMIVVPTSIFIVGVILYCLNFLMKVSVENLLLVAVAISIGMIVIYFTYLEKGYVSLLLQAVTKNMFSFSRSSKIGKEEIIILEKKLSSARPEEVVHALQMLENVMPKKMDNYLKLAIRTANADVKMYCLKKIFRLRINSLRSEVKSILENDKDPHVVGSAILTYSSIIKSVGDEYFEKINGSNPEVASSIISSYLAYGGASSKERAKQKLIEFSNSEKIEERIIAAKIIGNFFDRGVLLKLLKDPYDEVRRVACDNCNQVDKEIIRCVVDNLMRPHLKSSCIAVILRYPNIAFEEISSMFLSEKSRIQKTLISVLALLKTEKSFEFLQSLLLIINREHLRDVLIGLKMNKNSDIRVSFDKMLADELNNLSEIKKLIKFLGSENTEVLFTLLSREIEIIQQVCYLILSFLYPKISFACVDPMLIHKDENFESNLEEILILSMKKSEIKKIKECLLFVPKINPDSSVELKGAVLKILEYSSKAYIPSLKSAAIYTLGLLGFTETKNLVEMQSEDNDPLLAEFKPITLELFQRK